MIFTSFGDMMRVPGSRGTLLDAKAGGADIRFVYSPLDALRDRPARTRTGSVVFFAVGFETTAPSTAITLLRAAADRASRTSRVFSNHVTIVPPLKAILDSPDLRLDGFLGPGHVSTVVGAGPTGSSRAHTASPWSRPDSSRSTSCRPSPCCCRSSARAAARWRTSTPGSCRGRAIPGPWASWPRSSSCGRTSSGAGWASSRRAALQLRPEFARFDAELRYDDPGVRVADPKACQCGEVLKGVIKPWECKVFGTACTPETPIGTCMVSSEGACAAYYNFGRFTRERVREATRP